MTSIAPLRHEHLTLRSAALRTAPQDEVVRLHDAKI
jgi:hypothetical protein